MGREIKRIDIGNFAKNTRVLSGRPEGKSIRESLKLDELDEDTKEYDIQMPTSVRTINPSYFLGLFSKSIKNMGKEKFREKYKLTRNGDKLTERLERNVEEGIEWVLKEIDLLD